MRVRLRFPAPGFFINDPRVVVSLDGRTVYDGSFKDGFDVSLEVEPGPHVVDTTISVLGASRRQKIPLPLGDGSYRDVQVVEATLSYSRFWGNFTKRLALSTQG